MISLIHPSRGRPNEAKACRNSWLIKMSCDAPREYIIALDQSDPSLSDYEEIFYPGEVFVSNSKSAIEATNNAAWVCKGDIIVVISDDFECFENWDIKITEALEGKSGVLKTFDRAQKYICTMPIMTRDYYESKGHIYNPDYGHMFCDTHLTHVADLEGKLIIRNDLVFPHNHYSTGKSKKDALNIKNDSTWAQGEATYLRHCKNKFGLGNVDIFNLSKEAHQAGHVAWLKKKLR